MTEKAATMRTANSEQRTANSEQPDLCPLFSIILIVYNCGDFIINCLDSLTNQDIPENNYEIIITDDGSRDISGKICDEYAEKFNFIRVIHTKNFGESHARNTGLQNCRGKYIVFCDGDDAVSPQLISVLTKIVEVHNNPDIIFYQYLVDLPTNEWPLYDIMNIKKSDAIYIDGETLAVRAASFAGGYIWNKAFKSEIAKSVKFDETVKASEDQYWLMNILTKYNNARVCCIEHCLYNYIQHHGWGQTRDFSRMYDENGMLHRILTYLKGLEIQNISPRVVEQLKGKVYEHSVNALYLHQVKIGKDAYKQYKTYMRIYSGDYYLKYKAAIFNKLKMMIKHILLCLNIHK